MKSIFLKITILIGLVFSINSHSQSIGDFQSFQTGAWNNDTTWSRWDGSSWVNPAPSTPDSLSGVVTILSPHTITVTANVGVDQVTVNNGATVIVNCSVATLTIAAGNMTVNGALTINGNVPAAAPYNIITNGSLIIGATGVVNIDETAAVTTTKGFIPSATWQAGSTLNILGIGGAAATGWGSGNNQDFYNVNINYATGTANFGWGFTTGSVAGEFKVQLTGSTATSRMQFFGGSSGNVTLNKLTQTGGILTGSGTGSAATFDNVYINGDVSITGGQFSVDRGSHGGGNDGSGVKWYFYGDNITIAPTSTAANSMANSNSQGNVYPYYLDSRFIFAKSGVQNLSITPALVTSQYGITVEVINGSQVNLVAPSNIIILMLTSGSVIAPTANPLTMGILNTSTSGLYSGTIYGGGSTSNVVGKLGFLFTTTTPPATFSKTYPISKGGKYRPITLSLSQSAATLSAYYAEMFNSVPPANTLPGSVDKVSSVRYYAITEGTGGSAFTNGIVTLNYETDDGVTDFSNLRVVKDDGAGNWVDLGGVGTANGTGSIISTTGFTSLSNFTLANATGGGNILQSLKVLTLTALIEGFYDGSTMVSDTVYVELHNATSYALVEQTKTVLNSSGVGIANFSSASDGVAYYIALKHRNALQTWSAAGQTFSGGTLSYNFTSAQSQAYGDNTKNVFGKWCLFNGDVNADEFIDGSDVSDCFNDANIGTSGYVVTDLTGDDFVDGTDVTVAFNNSNIGAGAYYPSK